MSARRKPCEARPERMAPLARLPVFLALEGKRCVLVGDGQAVDWKLELLEAAGAVRSSATPCDGWTADDLRGAAIAVGGFEDDEAAEAFSDAARKLGVPVNVIDRPAFCDFSFGAIVNRSPLVIGISTDGAAPVFAQAIRAKLEALLPKGFADWAAAAARWRPALKASGLSFSGRRKFWQLFTAHAVANPEQRAGAKRFRPLCRRSGGPGRCGRERLGHAGRRRSRRPGTADAARGARAAIGRCDFVRRSGVARGARFCPPRGQENAGRQDRLWSLLQAGRHQRADGEPRAPGQARGAAQRRRSADLRPRGRGDRGLQGRRHRGRHRARHHGGARCCRQASACR